MKRDDLLLATIFSPDPITQRRERMRLWRGIAAGLALETGIALALVGAVWFVCCAVITK